MKSTLDTSPRSTLELGSYWVLISSASWGCASRRKKRGMIARPQRIPEQVGGLIPWPSDTKSLILSPILPKIRGTTVGLIDCKILKFTAKKKISNSLCIDDRCFTSGFDKYYIDMSVIGGVSLSIFHFLKQHNNLGVHGILILVWGQLWIRHWELPHSKTSLEPSLLSGS